MSLINRRGHVWQQPPPPINLVRTGPPLINPMTGRFWVHTPSHHFVNHTPPPAAHSSHLSLANVVDVNTALFTGSIKTANVPRFPITNFSFRSSTASTIHLPSFVQTITLDNQYVLLVEAASTRWCGDKLCAPKFTSYTIANRDFTVVTDSGLHYTIHVHIVHTTTRTVIASSMPIQFKTCKRLQLFQ